ncbi:Alpha/beta hydrolase fold-1 [Mycena belliarum]|uniref:Alpha/beta hydrolase fold-1 n=1 Tax=Mycena belliarum TaxID=1033014 RepID=A0AAD6TPX8_9AGAR|nr:Alpha/beta hydrolase fold-1 [Mycena belliae]
MASLSVEKFSVATNTRGVPLIAVGKRYTRSSPTLQPASSRPAGAALLFVHGTGFHKEIWEPTIAALFEADEQHAVYEAWAVDCQNHGESAVANEKQLFEHPQLIDIWEYANALATFRRDLIRQEKVIVVAHSAGAVAGVLVTMFFNPPNRIPFSSIVLVEPPLFTKDMYQLHKTPMYAAVATMTPLRRDIWASHKAAKDWLMKRPPWSSWSEDALESYVTYGLRKLPTAHYPDKQGVTLCCIKEDEAQAYASGDEDFDALWRLNQICQKLPVHVIWAEVDDLFSKELKDSIADPSQGRDFASITRVAESGHMVPQERPKLLGKAVLAIVRGTPSRVHKL